MTRMSRDPRWTISRFAGTDKNGNSYKKGDRVFYYPATKAVLAGTAAEDAARRFEAERQDEEGY
jgi:hypothetical protein